MTDHKILVAEDEPSISEVVSIYLRRAGYQVEVVFDGEDALESLQKELPDLIVLDLMLPKVDGLDDRESTRAGLRWPGLRAQRPKNALQLGT